MTFNRFHSLIFLLTTFSIVPALQAEQESATIRSVGYFEEEAEEDIADRDRDIPTLYEKNRMNLMRQRDRWLLRHGKCCPPPGVLVSPKITMPPREDGHYYIYDPRNERYRSADN